MSRTPKEIRDSYMPCPRCNVNMIPRFFYSQTDNAVCLLCKQTSNLQTSSEILNAFSSFSVSASGGKVILQIQTLEDIRDTWEILKKRTEHKLREFEMSCKNE